MIRTRLTLAITLAATLLSLSYGSLPFFAHQRVLRASAREIAANKARS